MNGGECAWTVGVLGLFGEGGYKGFGSGVGVLVVGGVKGVLVGFGVRGSFHGV